MRYAILAFALVMASQANAETYSFAGSELIMPPAKWRFEPLDKVDVYYPPRSEVTAFCSKYAGKYENLACTATAAPPEFPQCLVVIANEIPDELKQMVLIHEKAHCNGWPADHPLD